MRAVPACGWATAFSQIILVTCYMRIVVEMKLRNFVATCNVDLNSTCTHYPVCVYVFVRNVPYQIVHCLNVYVVKRLFRCLVPSLCFIYYGVTY